MTAPLSHNRLPELAALIKAADRDVRRSAERMAERAIEAGRLLIEAKESVGHGGWLPFLKNSGMGERTARRYMALARSGLKSATVADLGIVGALERIAYISEVPIPTSRQAVYCSDQRDSLFFLWPSADYSGFVYYLFFVSNSDGGCEGIAGSKPVCRDFIHELLLNGDYGFDFKNATIELLDEASDSFIEFLNQQRRDIAPTWGEQQDPEASS